ncbi:MAG TPA: proline racemase family protein [Terriglobales bacterium]|nr:proline racemase family protein [Terriglobales bacterium]
MSSNHYGSIHVIDSHTGGEPTRLIVSGGPDLGTGLLAERLLRFRSEFDCIRSAVVNEPRGSDVMVGGLLCQPQDPSCCTGVIFFNNVGYLGMCGHGTIGLVVTLAHMGKIAAGQHRIETPVGVVGASLHSDGRVTVENVPSYRAAAQIELDVPRHGAVRGDVAWGGNWFFLVELHGMQLELANVEALTDYAWAIRQELNARGISGDDGHEIDHVELFGPSRRPGINSRNFVLCPGKAYDRSPCGTGTSAKMACLYADGKFREGEVWRQESIVGSVFEGSIRVEGRQVYPSITGTAFVNAEANLILDQRDPFQMGIRI